MEVLNVETLQQQLAERIADLDKQRKEQAEKFSKELAERVASIEAERAAQLAVHKEAEAKRQKRKEEAEKEEQLRAQEARKTQIALEHSLAAAEEARKAQEEKLAWLVAEINKQEFIEEQHRFAMQQGTVAEELAVGNTEINVEHPTAPDNHGNAVQGTAGDTPVTPLMSEHLRVILRQATRMGE